MRVRIEPGFVGPESLRSRVCPCQVALIRAPGCLKPGAKDPQTAPVGGRRVPRRACAQGCALSAAAMTRFVCVCARAAAAADWPSGTPGWCSWRGSGAASATAPCPTTGRRTRTCTGAGRSPSVARARGARKLRVPSGQEGGRTARARRQRRANLPEESITIVVVVHRRCCPPTKPASKTTRWYA